MASTAPHLPVVASAEPTEGRWLVTSSALEPYADRKSPAPRDAALWSAAEALFATADGPPPPSRLAWLCDDLRDFLRHSGPRAGTLFFVALWVCNWIAPLFLGLLPPFRSRSLDERTRILAHLEHGASWQTPIVLALKSILSILYFEHPDAAREIGFDAACKGPET